MPNFCSSCGAKIKGDYKFCLNCGAQIKIQTDQGSFKDQTAQSLEPQTGQLQTYAPMQPKKSKTGLIIGIIIIVVILVVLLVAAFMFFGGGMTSGSGSEFYGAWETTMGDMMTYEIIFDSDNSLKYSITGYVVEIGTWKVNNNKLNLTIDIPGSEFSSNEYEYEFSDGGNTLELKIDGISNLVLTKK